jgi:hypothetical protein
VFREQVKLVVDSAMATTMVFGWITAVLCASHAIAREINNGTALLLLAKPVRRPVFILAKILGILLALVLFCLLTGLATMIAVRIAKDQFPLALSCAIGGLHNYVSRSSFPMAAVMALTVILPVAWVIVYWVPVNGERVGYTWRLVPALILILYSVMAMGTLATALSTRFDLVSNLLLCSVLFVIGLMSDYLLGRYADQNLIAAILYACIPNWQLFWMADALAAQKEVPWPYVGFGGAYIGLFVALFLLLAILMFHHREVGEQTLT